MKCKVFHDKLLKNPSIFLNFIVFIEVVTRQSAPGINVADIQLFNSGLNFNHNFFGLKLP